MLKKSYHSNGIIKHLNFYGVTKFKGSQVKKTGIDWYYFDSKGDVIKHEQKSIRGPYR